MTSSAQNPKDTLANTALELSSKLAPLLQEIEPFLKGLTKLSTCLAPLIRSLAPIFDALAPLWERWQYADNLLAQGWVPNHTTPLDLVADCGDDYAKLHARLLAYYTENWDQVRTNLQTHLSSYEIDDEAKATFHEALDAHEAGLYRSVSRLLFPEFERLFRATLLDGRAGQVPYRKFVEGLSGDAARLQLHDFLIAGIQDLVLFKYLTEGFRENQLSGEGSQHVTGEYLPGLAVGIDQTNVEQARQSPIPTRHSVVHGLVTYSSTQSSLNALFIADYVFSVVSRANAGKNTPNDIAPLSVTERGTVGPGSQNSHIPPKQSRRD